MSNNRYVVEKDWIASGLRCVAIAGYSNGRRCGYVGLPKTHPLGGVGYGDETPLLVELWEKVKEGPIGDRGTISLFCHLLRDETRYPTADVVFDVHGSITYGDADPEYPVPSDDLWWYGFDCGHFDDAPDPELLKQAGLNKEIRAALSCDFGTSRVVRDLAFVVAECEKLAAQLATFQLAQEPIAVPETPATPKRAKRLPKENYDALSDS